MSVEERLNELKTACDPYATCSNNMANEFCNEKYACGKCRLGLIAKLEQELADEYVRLPVDADGVPIHVGDMVVQDGCGVPYKVMSLKLFEDCWDVGECCMNPNLCHHYHKPTLEDVMHDYALAFMRVDGQNTDELDAEYAAKVREVMADV